MIASHRVGLFSGACLLLLGSGLVLRYASAQEPEDAGKILKLASQVEPKDALKHLTHVAKILGADKTLASAERTDLINRLARVLQEKARLPADILTVLGPQASKQVVRQVYYRRYLEHWIIEAPVGLCVTLDCAKGQDPIIRAIRVWSADSP